jgi:hypothetical protein
MERVELGLVLERRCARVESSLIFALELKTYVD